MKSNFSFGRDTLILAFSSSINKYLSVILIPIYTRYITPEGYGVISIIAIFSAILMTITTLALTNGISRYIYFFDKEDVTKDEVIWSPLIFIIVLTFIVLSFLISFSDEISLLAFGIKDYSYVIIISLISLFFSNFNSTGIAVLVFEKKVYKVLKINIIQIFFTTVTSLTLLIVFERGLTGIIEAGLISQVLLIPFVYLLSLKNYKFSFSHKILGKQLKFSLPLTIAIFAFFFIDSSDRYILNIYLPLSEVGLYNLGYQGALFIMILVDGFQLSWPPFYYSNNRNGEGQLICTKVFYSYLYISLVFVLFISLFAPIVLELLTPEDFHDAYSVVPYVVFAYALKGPYIIFLMGLLMKNKTALQLIIETIAASLNIILNIFLIQKIGKEGAAISTLACYMFMVIAAYVSVQRHNPIKDLSFFKAFQVILIFYPISFLCLFYEQIPNYFIVISVTFTISSLILAKKFISSYKELQTSVV